MSEYAADLCESPGIYERKTVQMTKTGRNNIHIGKKQTDGLGSEKNTSSVNISVAGMAHKMPWQALCLVVIASLAASSLPGAHASAEKGSDIKILQEHFNLIHDIYAAVGAKGAEKDQLNLRLIREAAAGKRMRRSIAIRSADDSQASAQSSDQLTTAATTAATVAAESNNTAASTATPLATSLATEIVDETELVTEGTVATSTGSGNSSPATSTVSALATSLVTEVDTEIGTEIGDSTSTAASGSSAAATESGASNATASGSSSAATNSGASTSTVLTTSIATEVETDIATELGDSPSTAASGSSAAATDNGASTATAASGASTATAASGASTATAASGASTATAASGASTATSAGSVSTAVSGAAATSVSSAVTTKKDTEDATELVTMTTWIEDSKEIATTKLTEDDDDEDDDEYVTEIIGTEIITEFIDDDDDDDEDVMTTSTPTASPVPTTTKTPTTAPAASTATKASRNYTTTMAPTTLRQTTTFWPTTMRVYEAPVAAIDGAATVSLCGTLNLNALSSRDNSGDALQYRWSVESTGNSTTLETRLDEINDENDGDGNALISLSGSNVLADTEVDYTFNLTVTNFVNLSDWTTFTVQRLNDAIFDVAISTNVDSTALKRSQRVSLTAEVTFYLECMEANAVTYQWTCDDSSVDISNNDARVATSAAYTLAETSTTTCTLLVLDSEDSDRNNSATVEFTTISTALVADISGGSQQDIGLEAGTVELTGTGSSDPDQTDETLVYSWACEQITDNTDCYKRDTNDSLLASSNTSAGVLDYAASDMSADKTYRFTLTVSKDTRSATASVDILAKAGAVPRVVIDVPTSTSGKVTATNTVWVIASIEHSSPLVSVEWTTLREVGYRRINLEDPNNLWSPIITASTSDDYTISQMFIKPNNQFSCQSDGHNSVFDDCDSGDVLRIGSKYQFSLTVTTEADATSTAVYELQTYAGVRGCELSVPDYTALDEVTFVTSGCYTDDEGYPLTYTLSVLSGDGGDTLLTVVPRSTSATDSFLGKSTYDGSSNAVYVVKVCDQLDSCMSVSDDATVSEVANLTESDINDFVDNHVNSAVALKQYIQACLNYGTLLNSLFGGSSSSRKRRAAAVQITEEDENNNLLKYIRLGTTGEELTFENVPVLIDQISYLNLELLNSTQRDTLLGYMETLVNVYSADDAEEITIINRDILFETYESLEEYGDSSTADFEAFYDDILFVMSKTAVTGGGPVEFSGTDAIISTQKSIPCDVTVETTTSDATSPSVDFGSEICSSYGPSWSSGSATHSGIAVETVYYSSSASVATVGVDSIDNTASQFIEISVANPDTGDAISISGLTTPITIANDITVEDEYSYVCKYWDGSDWSTSGVTTNERRSEDIIECLTTHLSTFVVVTEDRVLTTEAITTEAVTTAMVTNAATTLAIENRSNNNRRLVAIVIPTVLLAVILLAVIGTVLVIYLKRKSKIHSEILVENNEEAEDAEMGRRVTSRTEKSSSSNHSRGSNRVSPAPNNTTTTSHSLRPPSSPEPTEFLPDVDTDGRTSASGSGRGVSR